MNRFNVAIDGPSGAGKGISSKWLAKEFNLNYLDTGAMYRAIALHLIENNISIENLIIEDLEDINIYFNNDNFICLCGVEVESKIRNQKIAKLASDFSKLKIVRDFLEKKQKEIVKSGGVIAEGRDIGTVIIPDANVKIYLTADIKIRAKRRLKDLIKTGFQTNFDAILEEVKLRDKQDMEREYSPLKQADDAIVVDTSDLNLEEQNELLKKIILDKIKN